VNWLDIILLIILAYSTFRSFRRVFSREIIGLGASLFALVLAMWFYGTAGLLVLPWISSQRVANLLGFVLVVVGVLLLGALLGWVVNRFLRTVGLSIFDRFLGAAFGLARGTVVTVALVTAFTAFGPYADTNTASPAVLNSRIVPYLLRASHAFVAIAPMDLKESFRRRYSIIKSKLKGSGAPEHT